MSNHTIRPEAINILGGSKYPTLETMLTILGPTCDHATIYNGAGLMIYSGVSYKVMTTKEPFFEKLRAMHVVSVRDEQALENEYRFTLEEKTNPCSFMTISDFPKKEMFLADFLHFFDKKEILTIVDGIEEIYKDRQEYLEWTAEGEIHPLALRKVSWMEAGNDGSIYIHLEDEEEN